MNIRINMDSTARRLERDLREAIVTLEMPPGARFTEQEVADRYGVSRQPAREAILALSRARLLDVQSHRGTVVARISARRMIEARFVREAIEVAVVRRAAIAFDPAIRKDIDENLELQARAADRADRVRFRAHDEAFHRALAAGCDMPGAWDALIDIKSHLDRVCHLTIPSSDSMDALIEQHRAVIDAIDRGDADAAEAAIRHHLTEILRSLPAVEAAYPDLFE